MGDNLAEVEQAMVEIRRRQTRRALARTAPDHAPAIYEVLDAVEAAQHPTVTTIATALAIDQPRASKLVARAVSAGLVERVADQQDGRRAFLRRTDAGHAASDHLHATRQTAFAQAMRDWTDAEKAEFARLLARFVTALP